MTYQLRGRDISAKMQNILRYGEKPIEFQLETDGEFYYLASDVRIYFISIICACLVEMIYFHDNLYAYKCGWAFVNF